MIDTKGSFGDGGKGCNFYLMHSKIAMNINIWVFGLARIWISGFWAIVRFYIVQAEVTHQMNYMLLYLPEDINKLKIRTVRSK